MTFFSDEHLTDVENAEERQRQRTQEGDDLTDNEHADPVGVPTDELIESRETRRRVLDRFHGEVPQSIMLHNKADKSIDLQVDRSRSYTATQFGGVNSRAKSSKIMSGMTCRGKKGALSRFPQRIGRNCVRLYLPDHGTVVDPFAGHNSRMELCWREGHSYIGCDLSKAFYEDNLKIKQMLENENSDDMFPRKMGEITLHNCDSKHMPVEDEVGDFTITSPPYWDLEFYGEEEEQLGYQNSYETFLHGLGQVAKENYRCLKPGAFCVWFVNDFRKDGKFIDYHGDTSVLLREAGFTQWDMIISDLGGSLRAAFASQVVEQQILPKRHEYGLVYRKV